MSTEEEKKAFKEKLRSINFGMVPGGYRAESSRSNYDADALPDFPSKEEVLDMQASVRTAPVREVKLDDAGKPVN